MAVAMPLLAMRFGGVVFGLVCVTGVAGCDVVFGLDHLEPGQAARPDAAEPRVHGRLWERYVTNGSDLSPLVLERTYPATSVALSVTLDDGTDAPVTYHDDGTFELTRDRDDQPYRLVITVDGLPNEYQLDAPELAIPQIVAGRPDAAPLGKSLLQFSYAPQVVDLKAAQVASTGVYSLTNTGAYGPVVTMDWRTAAPTANARLGMLDASKNDRVYVLESRVDRISHPPLAYQVITAVTSAAVTQVVGQSILLPQPTPVVHDDCATLNAPNASVASRLQTAVGRSYPYVGGDWYVFAAPAPEQLGVTAPVVLASAGQIPPVDSTVTASFHDPFPGWPLLAQAGALGGFDAQLPDTSTPLRFYDAIRRYRTVPHDTAACDLPAQDMPATIAIAGDFELAGSPLDVDGSVLALPDADVELTWRAVAAGDVHYTSVLLEELIPVDGFTTSIARRWITTAGDRVLIERALFVPGKTYVIAVTFHTGRPNAATGDWTPSGDTIEFATTWSHYFVVQ